MGLKGTLEDLSVVDLIQFPHAGRKSGELALNADGEEAKLYYENGSLVHSVAAGATGIDVLVDLLSWTSGSFEFRQDIITEERTIDADLHNVLMEALKIHDEKQRAKSMQGEETGAAEKDEQAAVLGSRLTEFVGENDSILYACAISVVGELLAKAHEEEIPADTVDELLQTVAALFKSPERAQLQRVILEDDQGTVVSVKIRDEFILVVRATKDSPLGAVSMKVTKLAAQLE